MFNSFPSFAKAACWKASFKGGKGLYLKKPWIGAFQ
jgi:hypothetical protein